MKEVWGGRDRPHPEVPERIDRILDELGNSYRIEKPKLVGKESLTGIHSKSYINHLELSCQRISGSKQIFPFVFPRGEKVPLTAMAQRGFYAYDTVTPICPGTFSAGLASASCAIEGARKMERSRRPVYCLCRPPGHHAGREMMAGYCYINNAALAAAELRPGRVAILDIDAHHGNGTQEIFYSDGLVLFCSIHGDPLTRFPYAWGFKEEVGVGDGEGFNVNIPLPGETRGRKWKRALEKLLDDVRLFDPAYLVVSLGTDGLSNDGKGPLKLGLDDYGAAGRMIFELSYPTCIVQEGGYYLPHIGECVKRFLDNWT